MKTPAPPATRRLDPERTRQDILAVAHAEFAENGLSGARVDAIAAKTQTTKRMIYYYFGSKEGLYLAVLEQAYADIRAVEKDLALDSLPPAEAIARLIAFTLDYDQSHPDFVRLVAIENIHHARYLTQSEAIRAVNATAIDMLATILKRGQAAGLFRDDLSAVDVHLMISAFCFFRVANQHTFGALFQQDLTAPGQRDRHVAMITDAVLGLLQMKGRRPSASAPESKVA